MAAFLFEKHRQLWENFDALKVVHTSVLWISFLELTYHVVRDLMFPLNLTFPLKTANF